MYNENKTHTFLSTCESFSDRDRARLATHGTLGFWYPSSCQSQREIFGAKKQKKIVKMSSWEKKTWKLNHTFQDGSVINAIFKD